MENILSSYLKIQPQIFYPHTFCLTPHHNFTKLPYMKLNLTNITPAEAQAERDRWADYCRLHKMPQKECVRCRRVLPNTRAFFASKATGRVIRQCVECQEQKVKRTGKHLPKRGDCPICDEFNPSLALDGHAPEPVRICRRCLTVINQVARMVKVTPDVWTGRVRQYLEWRGIKP